MMTTTIAIIGAGNVGTALAKGWTQAGHSIVLGVKNPASPKTQAAQAALPAARVMSVREAAHAADVILVSAPPQAAIELADEIGTVEGIERKVIIDASNSIRTRPEPYSTAHAALKARTTCPHVVKCFNITGFENMTNPVYDAERGLALDMFMAGDSTHGKQIASDLAKDLGFAECYDFGGDSTVDLLEQFASAWINLAIVQKHGRDIGFKVMRRP